jgi:methionine-gamma-lyase
MNWSVADKSLYTRNGGGNQKYPEEKLASLSGGEDCVVLAGGAAAKKLIFANLKLKNAKSGVESV